MWTLSTLPEVRTMAECIPQGWSLVLPQWRSPAQYAVSSKASEKRAYMVLLFWSFKAVSGTLVLSTITASSKWHQGQTDGKRRGWLRDYDCKRRVETVGNIPHFSLDGLDDFVFFIEKSIYWGNAGRWEWDPDLFIRWDEE